MELELMNIQQSLFPLLRVTDGGSIPEEIEIGKPGFVLAQDGFYLVARFPYGVIAKRVWKTSYKLPANLLVQEADVNNAVRQIICTFWENRKDEIKTYGGYTEVGYSIKWKDGKYFDIKKETISTTQVSLQTKDNVCDGVEAVDIHTHPEGCSVFSTQDDADDIKHPARCSAIIWPYSGKWYIKWRWVLFGEILPGGKICLGT